MADIQEPYVIVNLGDQEKVENYQFPVREYPENDIVIVTTSKNTLSLIKVSDSKSFKSWSAPQNQQFSCPVISDGRSKLLLCVQNKSLLRRWNSDSDSIQSELKTKFSSNIRELFRIPGNEPLVIFENGSCNILSRAIENSAQETESSLLQNEYILRTEIALREKNVHVVYQVGNLREEKKSPITFYHLILSISDYQIESIRRSSLERKDSKLLSWTLNGETQGSPLLTLWSNGEICQHSWEFESFSVSCSLPSGPSWFTFKSLDSSHVLVAMREEQCDILELWDIKFKVRKRRKNIETIFDPKMQMELINNNIWILSANQVLLCTLDTGSSSLLSSVGKYSKKTEKKQITSQNFNWMPAGQTRLQCDSLEDSRTVSLICKENLKKCLEEKNAKGILKIIQKWNDIPESELYPTLLFFLEVDNKCLLKKGFPSSSDNDESWEGAFSNERSFCLNKVLSLPFNEGLLRFYLQKLTTDKVYSLLLHLHSLLKCSPLGLRGKTEITIVQLVNWINILMDVHFNFFTLTNDAKIQEFLIELNRTVNKYTQLYEEMDDLSHLVSATRQGVQIPTFQNKSLYQIEILDI